MPENTSTSLVGRDWEEDDDALAFAQTCLAAKQANNRIIEMQAEMNAHWVAGRQTMFYDDSADRMVVQDNPDGRVRISYNMLRTHTEAVVNKLAALGVQVRAEPATDDQADFDAAVNQNHVLRHYREVLEWELLTDRLDREVQVCGLVFAKVCWNPLLGDPYAPITADDLGMPPEQFAQQFGRPRLEGLSAGDVEVIVRTLHEISWGPLGSRFDEADWVLEAAQISRAEAKERWDLEDVSSEALPAAWPENARVWGGGLSEWRGTSTRQADQDRVLQLEVWIKAKRRIAGLQRGRHIVVVGNQVVLNGPNPYQHGTIPIVEYQQHYCVDETHSDTWVSNALGPQRDANQAIGQATESRELLANPTTYVDENAIVDRREWTNKIGGVRRLRAGSPPPRTEWGHDSYRSSATAVELGRLAIEDNSGIHAVSQGRVGPSVRSAAQVEQLMSADDERLVGTAMYRRRAHLRIWRLLLATLHQYADEERLIRIGGEESARRTMLFDRTMLGDIRQPIRLERYNIRLTPDTPPRNRGSLRQDLNVLLQGRWLTPGNPDHEEFLAQTMQMGYARRAFTDRDQARALQYERCRLMALGQYEAPAWYEPLEEMQRELRRFEQQPFFRQLAPERQGLFMRYEEELVRQRVAGMMYRELLPQAAMQDMGVPAGSAAPAAQEPAPAQPGQPPAAEQMAA